MLVANHFVIYIEFLCVIHKYSEKDEKMMEGFDGHGSGPDSNPLRLFSSNIKVKSSNQNYYSCLLLLRYCVS